VLRLYDSAESGNCYKVRLLLSQLGLPFEREAVDTSSRDGREDVLGGKNPVLRVPVLRLEDGRHLAESNAILWYLAERTPYVPDDRFDRASVLQWMFFEQYDHEPYVAVMRHRTLHGRVGEFADSEERRARGDAALAAMDAHLDGRPFLVGGAYTVADVALFAYTHVAGDGGFDLPRYPAVESWIARVQAQPGHVPITA
jgi:glutathione S-transferase